MKNRFVLAGVALLTLAACSSIHSINAVPFKGPNGNQAYSMKCSGEGRTFEMCKKKATQLCPQGYEVVEEKKPKLTLREKTAALANDSVKATAQDHFSVECN